MTEHYLIFVREILKDFPEDIKAYIDQREDSEFIKGYIQGCLDEALSLSSFNEYQDFANQYKVLP